MSHNTTATATAYFEAWTSGDLDTTTQLIADDIVFNAPGAVSGHGAEAFRAFTARFLDMLRSATMIAAYGDEGGAVLFYKTETHPVPLSFVAEYLQIKDGKVTSTHFVFDTAPYTAAKLPRTEL